MINYGKVYSDTVPKSIEVTPGAVFLASNIQPYVEHFDEGDEIGYMFDYIAYTKDEYIELLSEKNETLEAELLDTQEALCDIYEMIAGGGI